MCETVEEQLAQLVVGARVEVVREQFAWPSLGSQGAIVAVFDADKHGRVRIRWDVSPTEAQVSPNNAQEEMWDRRHFVEGRVRGHNIQRILKVLQVPNDWENDLELV